MPKLNKTQRRNAFILEHLHRLALEHACRVMDTDVRFAGMSHQDRDAIRGSLQGAFTFGASAALDSEDGKVRA